MDNVQKLDSKFETIAWGVLLIWWGLRWWPLMSLPDGTGMLVTGMILIGVNVGRHLYGVPTRGLTTVLAILALVWGIEALANSVLHLPFELPVFESLLIVSGLILLAGGLLKARKPGLMEIQ